MELYPPTLFIPPFREKGEERKLKIHRQEEGNLDELR